MVYMSSLIIESLLAFHLSPLGQICPKRSDPGGRLLVPLGIRLQKDAQMLMLIVERKASGNYRTSVPEDVFC